MSITTPTIADRRRKRVLQRGLQRRGAFRIETRMAVYVEAPAYLVCELRDISYTGLGFDHELPWMPGTKVDFCLELPTHGAVLVPTSLALQAALVRVGCGRTGLRLVDHEGDQARALQELVSTQQRVILAARRARENARCFPE
jgi:hypothetical protein